VVSDYSSKERHQHVSIGHAVSSDLSNWLILQDALHPDRPGSWDDQSIWTGYTVEHEGLYYLFYTGLGKATNYLQQIGLATSQDLMTWTRHPKNPILPPTDNYETFPGLDSHGRPMSWRHPYVFRYQQHFYLIDWDHVADICIDKDFPVLELSQIIPNDDGFFLFFNVDERHNSYGFCCHHSDNLTGPYQTISSGNPVVHGQSIYSTRIIQRRSN